MKTLKFALALILCLITLCTLVACKPAETGPETTETPETSAEPEKTIVLFENDEWTHNIVRSDKWSNTEASVLVEMRESLRDTYGSAPKPKNDYKRDDESYDKTTTEFYYGFTAHEEMREFYATLGYGEAAVKVVGNKILLAGYTSDALEAVSDHLEKVMAAGYKDGRIEVKVSDLEMKVVVNEEDNAIPIPANARYMSTENADMNNDHKQTLIIFGDASADIFKEYQKKFEEYELVQNIESNDNLFATYQVGDDLLNISYVAHDQKLRVIRNPDTKASSYLKETEVKKTTTPLVIMNGIGWDPERQNGLSLLFRLEDGRFIIVDGGFNRDKDASDLFKLIQKYTPAGQEMTIAAWFITHAHGDHHATFASKFVAMYGHRVKIQSLIFNPPSPGINQVEGGDGAGFQTIYNTAAKIEGCRVVRCHPGDRYYIGGAVIDMLYTVDLQYPTAFTYYNTCSHIFSVQLGGQRIMVTGDGANSSFGHVARMYGNTLKADIVQVAHHGYGTGVAASSSTDIMQAYSYMSPSLVLWPIGPQGYETVKNSVFNKHLVGLGSVKEVVVAESSVHVFELPYTAK